MAGPLDDLKDALARYDRPRVERRVDDLVHEIDRTPPDALPKVLPLAEKALGLLRRKRHFDLMARVADRLVRQQGASHNVFRQYAQALIDQQTVTAAVPLLEGIVAGTADGEKENKEAHGLIGRAYKQIYVDGIGGDAAWRRDALNRSVAAYGTIYDASRDVWHGVNLVALLHRAHRDGVSVHGYPDALAESRRIATALLAALDGKANDEPLNMWDMAVAAEANLALGDGDAALDWCNRYVQGPYGDEFEFASTLRQLTEVWELDTDDPTGGPLVEVLKSALLQTPGGGLSFRRGETFDGMLQRLAPGDLQKRLGDAGYLSFKNMKDAVDRGYLVAQIRNDGGDGIGTGFMIRGGDLRDDWGDDWLMLTNAHVLSDRDDGSAFPDEVSVDFEGLRDENEACKFTIDGDLLASSPESEFDYTVARLSATPSKLASYKIAKRLPTVAEGEEPKRVYVIGHPGGRKLSFSMQDNALLDHEAPYVHYMAPTENGSSGSPVFDQTWKLTALHHAGSKQMPRLNGKGGEYPANEGIWLQSIIGDIRGE